MWRPWTILLLLLQSHSALSLTDSLKYGSCEGAVLPLIKGYLTNKLSGDIGYYVLNMNYLMNFNNQTTSNECGIAVEYFSVEAISYVEVANLDPYEVIPSVITKKLYSFNIQFLNGTSIYLNSSSRRERALWIQNFNSILNNSIKLKNKVKNNLLFDKFPNLITKLPGAPSINALFPVAPTSICHAYNNECIQSYSTLGDSPIRVFMSLPEWRKSFPITAIDTQSFNTIKQEDGSYLICLSSNSKKCLSVEPFSTVTRVQEVGIAKFTKCEGGDLNCFPIIDPSANYTYCQAQCLSLSGCVGWSYSKAESIGSEYDNCCLKKQGEFKPSLCVQDLCCTSEVLGAVHNVTQEIVTLEENGGKDHGLVVLTDLVQPSIPEQSWIFEAIQEVEGSKDQYVINMKLGERCLTLGFQNSLSDKRSLFLWDCIEQLTDQEFILTISQL